ncbi:DUF547 domain-containing protein [Photobacterium frigidiphilum]|uniref:DUF547 domain-containing protein n=1 Tax=Photobacterium frigidiphilum TaxID=264736 RepID=A0A2T3JG24_9GAMM|nr:DUF547 domain-containing protein [Photobacterium frigidiphilum]PSU47893.1 DUF547 domain-containing protein [Photobacterium frigidiphilum]
MRSLISIALLLFSTLTFAAPKAELWAYWQPSNNASSAQISHARWQQILDKFLITESKQTLFRYSAVTTNDKDNLDRYLRDLARIDPRQYSKNEQFAYWVNLYNALTVQLILDNYPIKSITKLGGFFSFGPWDDTLITIADQQLTLNDIEHRILRPIWRDPRVHYAVNCASFGCPNLLDTAFNGQNKNTLLEQAATDFINSSKGVSITGNQVRLSSIYDWFSSDFGNQSELQMHLNQYRKGHNIQLNSVSYGYDWSLNQAK